MDGTFVGGCDSTAVGTTIGLTVGCLEGDPLGTKVTIVGGGDGESVGATLCTHKVPPYLLAPSMISKGTPGIIILI